jgi:4-carboxymuconolactone decarboxylase
VTIAALASQGDDEQLEPYVRRGLESGLTRAEMAEAFTHLAFYAGWGKAGQALAVLARTADR